MKSANSSQPEEPVSKPVPIGLTGKDLNIFFETQQKSLEKQLRDLKLALLGHTSSVSERLSIETIKRAEESEKRLLEALNRFVFHDFHHFWLSTFCLCNLFSCTYGTFDFKSVDMIFMCWKIFMRWNIFMCWKIFMCWNFSSVSFAQNSMSKARVKVKKVSQTVS